MRLDRSETVLLGAVLLYCATAITAKAIEKREISPDMLFQAKDKRPFCNAFTGCGRKRSDLSMLGEAAGGLNGGQHASQPDTRIWEDMLSAILNARQDQAAPMYYRGRRSAPLEGSSLQTPEVNEAQASKH